MFTQSERLQNRRTKMAVSATSPRTSHISVIFFITDELLVRKAVALWV
jgi:hypothetical protein